MTTESNQSIGKMDRFIFGVLLPIVSMVIGLVFIMAMESSAGAAEFAALGIFLIVIILSPILLISNMIIATVSVQSRKACFQRGMILPAVVMIGALLYQLGLWDAVF